MPITDYTIDELMVVCLARGISDGDMVFHGVASPLPMTALYTAKQTHAPHMIYLAGVGGAVDPTPPFLPESTNDIWMQWGSIGIMTIDRVFDYFARIEVPVMFFSGGQIDKYGNINNTGIWEKPWEKFRTKFPGGAGACNLSSLTPKIVAWTTRQSVITHKKTGKKLYTLVDKVDFVTSVGYLNGPGERERVGCTPNTGPYKVVTELAVFGFDEHTKIMKLESLHPDVTVEDIIENTEFKPAIPKHVPTTPPPTKEQVRLIRAKIDPFGIRKLEFRSGDELSAIKGPGAKECDERRFKF